MCTVKQPSIYCCCGKLTTNNYLYPGTCTKPRKAKVSTRVSSLKKEKSENKKQPVDFYIHLSSLLENRRY
jgi:hypothetical protein